MSEEKIPKGFTSFIDECNTEMESHGVEILLPKTPYVQLSGGLECNGFFVDEPKLILACGCGKSISEWFPVYIHEYCHFTQWRDKIPEWSGTTLDELYYDDFLDEWLEHGTEFSQQIIHTFIDVGIAIEADCERRVVKILNERNLPLDAQVYAQKANAYVHFYNYIRINRVWYEKGKEPYRLERVWSQFNTEVDDDFSISWEYMDLYQKYCF